jgi:aminoglycoside 6'-N-acetyltransferase I
MIPVTEQNLQEWAILCDALWADDGEEGIAEEYISEWRNGELPHEFLYYSDSEAVAFVSLDLRHDYVEGTDTSPVGYLEGIYVKPEFQNKGIAREMVEFAKDWAKERGCTELASDCDLWNKESILFHEKVGFEEANRIVCFTMKLA